MAEREMHTSYGKVLWVDLTKSSLTEQDLDESTVRKYIGGRAFGAKILLEELRPGIDALGPDNKLVVSTGIVTGIPFAGNCRYVVMAKSPLTNAWGEANASGYFGPELRFAGFNHLIIEGRARSPVYLYIKDGKAEIRDAEHLWGKTTGETHEAIQDELHEPKARILSIGVAGENLVRYACVLSELHRANGRCGMGAVMGSKKLKSIAVRGTRKLKYFDEKRLMELCRLANKEVWQGAYGDLLFKYGTDGDLDDLHATGRLPTKNFTKCTFSGYQKITGETMAETILIGRNTCYACPIACPRKVAAKEPYEVDPDYGGPEYESTAALGSLCMIDNMVAIAKANELCNKYGLDTISTGVTISFAMECYEKGLLTEKETDGLDLKWGNSQASQQLIEKIAKREGIGDLLAEGVMRASKRIGRGAEKFAMHIKGQEVPMHEPRGKKGLGLSYATSNRGACHLQAEHDDFFEDPKWLRPELGIDKTVDRLSVGADKARLVKVLADMWAIYDCLSLCKFTGYPEGGVEVERVADIVNAATGWNVTPKELMTVGERAINLCRIFNAREGMARKDDTLPERLMEPLTEGMYEGQGISRKDLDEMLDYYYEYRGWDKRTGWPTKSNLEELSLKEVWEALKI